MVLRKALFSPPLWLRFDCLSVALHPYPSICPWKFGPLLYPVGNVQVPVFLPVKEVSGEGSRCANAKGAIAVYLVA